MRRHPSAIEKTVSELLHHARERIERGGYGPYPDGVLFAVEKLLPFVDAQTLSGGSIHELFREVSDLKKERLRQRR